MFLSSFLYSIRFVCALLDKIIFFFFSKDEENSRRFCDYLVTNKRKMYVHSEWQNHTGRELSRKFAPTNTHYSLPSSFCELYLGSVVRSWSLLLAKVLRRGVLGNGSQLMCLNRSRLS